MTSSKPNEGQEMAPKKPYEGLSAIGYCRVSTDDKGQTNETQARAIREWAERTGATLVEIYYDEMTGTTLARPGLMQAVGRIRCDGISILVAFDSSRLTRNEDIPKIKEMIGEKCTIRYTSSDIDTESLGGRITDAVRQIFDHEENVIRSAKTSLGMVTRRDQMGIHVGRPAKIVFVEELATCKTGLRSNPDETHKTQSLVYPTETILSFADRGISLNHLATKILDITPMSLRRALIRNEKLGEYKKRYEQSRRFSE